MSHQELRPKSSSQFSETLNRFCLKEKAYFLR